MLFAAVLCLLWWVETFCVHWVFRLQLLEWERRILLHHFILHIMMAFGMMGSPHREKNDLSCLPCLLHCMPGKFIMCWMLMQSSSADSDFWQNSNVHSDFFNCWIHFLACSGDDLDEEEVAHIRLFLSSNFQLLLEYLSIIHYSCRGYSS